MQQMTREDMEGMLDNAHRAAEFLKALSNSNRLIVLCILSQGERSVSDLEEALGIRQPTLSQQLAVLREQSLVETRREGKTIYYRLASREAERLIGLLYEMFCADQKAAAQESAPGQLETV